MEKEKEKETQYAELDKLALEIADRTSEIINLKTPTAPSEIQYFLEKVIKHLESRV